jgi:hypothetical protein
MVHIEHIEMKHIEHVDELVEDSFGLWIDGLFSAIHGQNPDITFQEQKEAFFWLVERLLRAGKIKFCPPNELWYEGYDIWDADVPTIMEYLLSRWPDEADSRLSIELVYYFYRDIPVVVWVAADGTLHSSW